MHFLLDIGGTKTRIASTKDFIDINNITIISTNQDYGQELELIKSEVERIANTQEIESVCVGIAGVLNKDLGILESAPNLRLWVNKPLVSDFKVIFKTENVYLENDAALAALAEANLAENVKDEIIAYLSVGTGVGGARVVNGVLDESTFGFEPGHQIINFDKNGTKTLEDYISGSGIKRRLNLDLKDNNLVLTTEFRQDFIRNISIGLYNISLFWSPDLIIIGGGLGISDLVDLDLIRVNFNSLFQITKRKPKIKKAVLKDLSGIYGASTLLKNIFEIK